MATRTWLGATSGDWGVTTNWSGSTVPIAGDTALFDGTSDVAVNAGLDQSLVDLAQLLINDDYSGLIGSAGNNLQIGATLLRFAGQGVAYLEGASSGFVEANVSKTATGANSLFLDGIISKLRLQTGEVQILTGAAVTTIDIPGTGSGASKLDIVAGVTGITDLRSMNATLTLASAVTNLRLVSGVASVSAGALTLAEIYGGTLNLNASDLITMLRLFGGKADFRSNVSLFTVTDCEAFKGTIDRRNQLGGGTWTNGIEVLSASGVSILDDVGVVHA